MPDKKKYLVVGRSDASALFNPTDLLEVPLSDGGKITFATRYSDEGYEAPVPRGIVMIAEYVASNVNEAVEAIGDTAQGIKNRIELGVNAWLGEFEIEIVLEVFPGPGNREFFQSFVAPKPLDAVPARIIDLSIAGEMIYKIQVNPERDRLVRAIAQYHEALRYWSPGSELICAEHIFMGTEALKIAALRQYLRTTGKTEQELGNEWGYEKRKRMDLASFLKSKARLRLIFLGDKECHKFAKDVSDGFEHGFTGLDFLKENARQIIVSSAKYLREGILRYSGISEKSYAQATSPQFVPRGPLKLLKYLWGSIEGDSERLADAGKPFPYVKWESSPKRIYRDEKGVYVLMPNESLTAVLGKGVRLSPGRFEVWDGSTIIQGPMPRIEPQT